MQSRLDAFRQQRDALQKRLLDPERAFREHMQRGTQLARTLADTAQRHAIGENRMNSAMQAFESVSYDEVMALCRQTERLLLVQAASSAYAQGLIEEEAVNLHDALDHYKRTYDLDATLEHQEAYARLYWLMGRWDEAMPLLKDILKQTAAEHGKAGNEYANALNNLAAIYRNSGRYEAAEPLHEGALSITRCVLGVDHPDTAVSLNNLALLYRDQGRYDAAEPLYEEALLITRRILGADHPAMATSLNNLAGSYDARGRYAEAEPLYTQALLINHRVLGGDHPNTASSLNNLASLYYACGRYAEAEPLYKEALEIMEWVLGVEHPNTTGVRANYGRLLAEMKE